MATVLIPSSKDAVAGAIKQLLAEVRDAGYGDHEVFAVHLALEEALLNAVEHGNKLDHAKNVSIRYNISPRELRFRVTDEGEGFRPTDVPDPTQDTTLERESGRGILLMRTYMDEVSFNEKGNEVVLVKYAKADKADAGSAQGSGAGH